MSNCHIYGSNSFALFIDESMQTHSKKKGYCVYDITVGYFLLHNKS